MLSTINQLSPFGNGKVKGEVLKIGKFRKSLTNYAQFIVIRDETDSVQVLIRLMKLMILL